MTEDNHSIVISERQKKIIQSICNNRILNADFRNVVKYNKKDKTWTTNWLCIYLWFYRYKFNFKYPDNILLDMLEFEFSVDGKNVGIDYIEKQVNKIEVRNRIVENINNKEIHNK